MLRFVLRRLLTFPLLLIAVYSAAVLLIMATPGEGLEGGEKDLPPEVLQQKRIAYNYDRLVPVEVQGQPVRWEVRPVPAWERYFWIWPKRLLWDRDLPAHQYEDWTVVEIMRSALPVSLQLGVLALGLAVTLGLAGGAAAVAFRGRWPEHLSLGLCLIGISLPTFVIGAVLLIVVALWLGAVPVGGWGRPTQAILPAITLALPYAAYIARLTRSALLSATEERFEYVPEGGTGRVPAEDVVQVLLVRKVIPGEVSFLGELT